MAHEEVGAIRPRRLRRTALLREIATDVHLPKSALMMPHFVLPGENTTTPVDAMPGINRVTIDRLIEQVGADLKHGINKVLLFGVPETKSADDALVSHAVHALKKEFGADLLVATDVCLCAYTDHGHCGVLEKGEIHNDHTLPLLSSMALAHAQAGADIVAPSDMMDGRVGSIRKRLDSKGYETTAIMSYAVKFASAYYGPFREAAGSAPSFGDRKSYQMDPRNTRQVVREVMLDTAEGADIVMVKPALAYLDVIATARSSTTQPIACYNVSGEYAMVKAAAQKGWVDERAVVLENLYAMRRAGADLIITYHARDALSLGWL